MSLGTLEEPDFDLVGDAPVGYSSRSCSRASESEPHRIPLVACPVSGRSCRPALLECLVRNSAHRLVELSLAFFSKAMIVLLAKYVGYSLVPHNL